MDTIDTLDYVNWDTPAIVKPVVDVPTNESESNTSFLNKCADAYLINPERIHSHSMRVFLRDLNAGTFKPPADGFWGSEFSPFTNRTVNQPFTRQNVVDILKNKLTTSNAWEQARVNPELLTDGAAKWLN